MTIVVMVILVGIWAAYLIPPMLQGRGRGTGRASGGGLAAIGEAARRTFGESETFSSPTPAPDRNGLRAVPTPDLGGSLMPRSSEEARQRRMLVIGVLAALAVVTLLAVPALGVPVLMLHVGIDALLGAMLYLSTQRQPASTRTSASVVRSLDFHRQIQGQRAAEQAPEHELVRRIAN